MRKRILFSLFVFSVSYFAFGQQSQWKRCATWESLTESDRQLLEALEPIIQAKVQSYQSDSARHNWTVWKIPVVFHVLYRNNSEKPSQAQIDAQLDVLNRGFRGLIANAGNTPPEFLALLGDVRIEFVYAQEDPWGNPTTGVNWVNTTPPNGVCFNTGGPWQERQNGTGGVNPWDPNRYLNIWICNLCGGVLGIATFPGSASPQGVSIHYQSLPGGSPPYDQGYTAVHEVGHFFGLRHIWGDNQPNCYDDKVGDTPPQDQPTFGCPSHPSPTCNHPAKMFQNFMDYSDDACLTLFTQGQAARIRAFIETVPMRWNLAHSDAGNGNASYDLMINDILYPVLHTPTYTFNPQISILNLGSNTVNNFNLSTYLDGTFLSTTPWSGNLNPGNTVTVILPSITVTPGPHLLQFIVSHPSDSYTLNDTAYVRFSTPYVCTFSSDFETDTLPNANWDVINPDFEGNSNTVGNQGNALTWARNVKPFITGITGTSTFSAYVNNYYYVGADPGGGGPKADTLESPYIDLSSATPPITLSFDVAYAPYDNTYCEDLEVWVSTDQKASWTQIFSKSCNTLNTTGGNSTNEFYPSASNQWRTETINLDAYAGQLIILRFVNISRYGNNLYLDNVSVNSTCAAFGIEQPLLYASSNYSDHLTISWKLPVRDNIDSLYLQILLPKDSIWKTLWKGPYLQENSFQTSVSKDGIYFIRLYGYTKKSPNWKLLASTTYSHFTHQLRSIHIFQSSHTLTIQAPIDESLVLLTLYSIDGRQILQTHLNQQHEITLPIENLLPGTYLLQLTTDKKLYHKKILILEN